MLVRHSIILLFKHSHFSRSLPSTPAYWDWRTCYSYSQPWSHTLKCLFRRFKISTTLLKLSPSLHLACLLAHELNQEHMLGVPAHSRKSTFVVKRHIRQPLVIFIWSLFMKKSTTIHLNDITDDTTIIVIYKSLIMEIVGFIYPSVWTVVLKNLCLKRVCSPSPSPYPIILTRIRNTTTLKHECTQQRAWGFGFKG